MTSTNERDMVPVFVNNSTLLRDESSMISQNQSVSSFSSFEERLKQADYVLSVLKNRCIFLSAKCEAPLGTTRFLSFTNATAVERNYVVSLSDLFQQLEYNNIFEMVFKRCVESRILWGIFNQNIFHMNDSFRLPQPTLQNFRQKEKDIINSVKNLGSICNSFVESHRTTEESIIEYLDATKNHVNQLEKLRHHKAKLKVAKQGNANELNAEAKKRQRILDTNTLNGVISNMIISSNMLFEDPELVNIISEHRNVVTESSITRDAENALALAQYQ